MDIVLGIDAGGSKTLALAAGADGRELGRARSGPGNYHAVGFAAASSAITDAVRDALSAAGAEASQVRAICLGAAGVDRPEDGALWLEWARQAFPGAAAQIVNDALIVLAAGGAVGCGGLAVIAGTGSIVYGRGDDGRTARAGGWGYLLGDEGSNYAIGLAALRSVCRAADNRGPQTLLTGLILDHWSLARPADLVGKVYGEIARKDIARLGRLVEQADEAGDRVAYGIMEEAGRDLALTACSVVRQLDLKGPHCCALAGAVLLRGQHVRAAFFEASRGMGLVYDPLALVEEPAQGAVALAVESLHPRLR